MSTETDTAPAAITLGATAGFDVVVIDEGFAPLDLPRNAVLNDDGSVTLTFEFPRDLQFKAVGGAVVKTEHHDHLVLRRLRGPDVVKILASKRSNETALALACGISAARVSLLLDAMDAADATAARNVVAELLGGLGDGLPAHAQPTDAGYTMPLRDPVTTDDGDQYGALSFRRLTGGDLKVIGEASDTIAISIHRACGLTIKQAKDLLALMDGADTMDVNRVIGFLAGIGRQTGR